MTTLEPLALLIEEMKSEELEVRIAALKRLRTIGLALGPDRSRTELINVLNDSLNDDDEVLVELGQGLGNCIDVVGGGDHAACLLAPLEQLAGCEETVVRDKASESICKVIGVLSAASITAKAIPMLKRLCTAQWFTSRVSAAFLFASMYPKVGAPDAAKELRGSFDTLCHDDTPMVRRAAAKNLGSFAATVQSSDLLAEIIPLYKGMCKDDHDSVRLLAIAATVPVAKLLSTADANTNILPVVRACVDDKSWRARQAIARNFGSLAECMPPETRRGELLPMFANLLHDPDAEVKSVAVMQLVSFTKQLGADQFVQLVLPSLSEVSQDPDPKVRANFAEMVMKLPSLVGNQVAATHLMPFIQNLLSDEVSEVQSKILASFKDVAALLPADAISEQFLPTIVSLLSAREWRVRASVLRLLPTIATVIGPVLFNERLLTNYISVFEDTVTDVRVVCASCLGPLVAALGTEWAASNILPKLTELYNRGTSYNQRITFLHCLKSMAASADGANLVADLQPTLVRSLTDGTPNVRLIAAQTVQASAAVLDSLVLKQEILPALQEMTNDADLDCKFYAALALDSC